ncbi:MAG TPA: hypothetical protein G4O12_08560 [Dehalococcoidia bacterium]|nr:hypothetical protein [Dehalococcoidia bacterium]
MIVDWLITNKEWLLSGIAIAISIAIFFCVSIRREHGYVRPRTLVRDAIFYFMQVVFLIIAVWLVLWFPALNLESSRWAVSAQTQATAAILGLLIAAWIFRLNMLQSQEGQIREEVLKHLHSISLCKQGRTLDLEIVYRGLRKRIGDKNPEKLGLIYLGRLWAIIKLSIYFAVMLPLPRYLKQSDIAELSASKVSKNAALDMWEDFHANISAFQVHLFETLHYVHEKLAKSRSYKPIVDEIGERMMAHGTLVKSGAIMRMRSQLTPIFYVASSVLALAVIVGLCTLTGMGEMEVLTKLFGEKALSLMVGGSIGLSVFGIYFCQLLIFVTIR